jgi:hypothetical protein
MYGKTVMGFGGPIKTGDMSTWSVAIAGEVADRSVALSPVLGASIGLAGVKKSDENHGVRAPSLNGLVGIQANGGRVGVRAGLTHRVIFTLYGASDTELLRYSTVFAGVRARF